VIIKWTKFWGFGAVLIIRVLHPFLFYFPNRAETTENIQATLVTFMWLIQLCRNINTAAKLTSNYLGGHSET